ncbi:hypothetical protein JM18_003139 [Phytophthora kernoviae]|uniref:Piwi domain-containing protein n=1 Tax=Phytophthora kernoviae TaxID=325452 RepID=A0A921VAF0_9STRA|nr:hypothetical protein JM18_003139 [Phytophthora kernoviae]
MSYNGGGGAGYDYRGHDSRGGGDQRRGYDDPNRPSSGGSGGGYDQQRRGYDQQREGYDQQHRGYDQQREGYDQQRGGYDQQHGGYDQQRGGYDQQRGGYDQHGYSGQQQQSYDQRVGHDQREGYGGGGGSRSSSGYDDYSRGGYGGSNGATVVAATMIAHEVMETEVGTITEEVTGAARVRVMETKDVMVDLHLGATTRAAADTTIVGGMEVAMGATAVVVGVDMTTGRVVTEPAELVTMTTLGEDTVVAEMIIGNPIADPRIEEQWSGRAAAREVHAEDADLQQEIQICRRPGVARSGRTVQLNVNYFGVSLASAPVEIFKYHVAVERSPDLEADSKYGPSGPDQKDENMGDEPREEGKDTKDAEMAEPSTDVPPPKNEPRPERPLPRSLVRNIINAALRQYEGEFGGVRVVHDGMAALYSPTMLPWNSKDFTDVNPDSTNSVPAPPPAPAAGDAGDVPRRRFRGPRTFVVKMKLVETISTASLKEYYTNPDVNVMPVLQALDVVARHLGAQRLIAVGRNFFTMKKTHTLKGGKELAWGYHQALRLGDQKLFMNVDQAATVFYSPGPLMQLAVAALRVRGPDEVRNLAERDMKSLARGLRKIEVVPTHRKDHKRAIFGVSAQPADQTMVDIKGETMSVAAYFSRKYNMQLRYPNLPLVNVGSKRAGKENWLPIELCEVAPGQRCANINDLDTAEIIRQTSQPPKTRQENIMGQIRQAGFENDPFLAAFGMKLEQHLEATEARVMDAPDVQYQNVSERPAGGQWSLNGKKIVEGVPLRNWGVIIVSNSSEREVSNFIQKLCDLGSQRGLPFEDRNPVVIHQDQHRGAQVEELMRMCFQELERRNKGPPQLLMVILPDKRSSSYGDVKRMSDTVLGLPSQCIASANLPRANPQFCANVCLKINMKLNGKNAVLRDSLPLISTSPTIIIGADVEHPRSGQGSRPSIAAVVASMDRYSAQYATRVAAQKTSSDIQQLPHMLRELFLAYYENTKRKPEHVVYYRDGVSEGQMFDILQTEMRALRKAFKMISEDYNPPVTFIVVNKRHHLRAFAVNQRDADRKGNVMPGTVIDTGVVNPHRFDFFLYGHSGIQGTTVPAHYTVLHDENQMSAEDVQRLTYHLGYTFSRCTRSVSFVTPVYYAHLASARARFFLNEGSDGASTVGSYNSNMSSFEFADVHAGVLNRMFYIVMHWDAETKRMQPTPEGVAFYHALLDDLEAHMMQAVVTLYHFDLPAALQSQLEPTTGWLNPDIVTHFEEFAELAFREFGGKVKYWATFNEPLTFISGGYGSCDAAPGGVNPSDTNTYTVAHHVLLSHAKAVEIYRRLQEKTSLVDKKSRIGIVLNAEFGYPVNETNALDVAAAERKMQFDIGWFLMPLVTGDYPEVMRQRVGNRLPQFTPDEAALVKGSYDIFMLNHYYSRMVTDCDSPRSELTCDELPLGHARDRGIDDTRAPSGARVPPASNPECSWLTGYPDGYLATIKWLHTKDPAAAILLTENGWCGDEQVENLDQLWYFQAYVEQVYKAVVEDNIPIIGYTAWSFLDNNEWGSYKQRFGLHYVNFTTETSSRSPVMADLTRIPRPAAKWFAHVSTTKCLDGWALEGVEQTAVEETGEVAAPHERMNPEAGGNGVNVPWSLGEVIFLVVVGIVVLCVITCEALRELRQSNRGSPEELEVLITIE